MGLLFLFRVDSYSRKTFLFFGAKRLGIWNSSGQLLLFTGLLTFSFFLSFCHQYGQDLKYKQFSQQPLEAETTDSSGLWLHQ